MSDKTKLLLVDDEEEIRKKLALWLNRKNYIVETAANGAEAISNLGSFNPDILVTDLKMPGVDGIDLIKNCLNLKPEIGIIVITGHGDVDSYIETLNMGVFEFLNKPFGLEDLEVVLKKLIQKMSNQLASD